MSTDDKCCMTLLKEVVIGGGVNGYDGKGPWCAGQRLDEIEIDFCKMNGAFM